MLYTANGRRRLPALCLLALVPTFQNPPDPQCGGSGEGPENAPMAERRWGGFVRDVFVLDDIQAWTVEGGGRIRYTADGGLTWKAQAVPASVRSTLRSIHFLDDGLNGWCVGEDGWILSTHDGGQSWNVLSRIETLHGEWADLHDVHFIDQSVGWVLEKSQILYTTDGGACWNRATIRVAGADISPIMMEHMWVYLYAMDVYSEGGRFVGLACAEPGWVFRTDHTSAGQVWELTFDVRSLCGASPCGLDFSFPGETAQDPCFSSQELELYDIEISRNLDHDNPEFFAVTVGGIGTTRGAIFASTATGSSLADTTLGMPGTWHQEFHECDLANPGQLCAPPTAVPGPWNLLRTLYGVAVFSDDNRALAIGYNGQYLVRDPSAHPPGGCHGAVWRDESLFSVPFTGPLAPGPTEDHPVTAFLGVDADTRSHTGMAVGQFGHIALRDDTTGRWDGLFESGPFRCRDLVALGTDHLVQCGQLNRIAESFDGGRTWQHSVDMETMFPGGFPEHRLLRSITFAADGETGVAVGEAWANGFPTIFHKSPTQGWTALAPEAIQLAPSSLHAKLRAVTWVADGSGPGTFWAVGQNGTILRSVDGGNTFQSYVPAGHTAEDLSKHDFRDVEFAAPNIGVVVGHELGQARAYMLRTDLPACVDVAPADPQAYVLTSVAIRGVVAVAVGRRGTTEGPGGAVWIFDRLAGRFARFEELSTGQHLPGYAPPPLTAPPAMPECVGDAADEVDGISVLNDAVILANGDVWLAGECGRLVQYVASEDRWIDHKSQTGAHLTTLSFPNESVGYASGVTGQTTIIRIDTAAASSH